MRLRAKKAEGAQAHHRLAHAPPIDRPARTREEGSRASERHYDPRNETKHPTEAVADAQAFAPPVSESKKTARGKKPPRCPFRRHRGLQPDSLRWATRRRRSRKPMGRLTGQAMNPPWGHSPSGSSNAGAAARPAGARTISDPTPTRNARPRCHTRPDLVIRQLGARQITFRGCSPRGSSTRLAVPADAL